jgi:PAS domain S-box-containing protein
MPLPERESRTETESELFRLLVENVEDYAVFAIDAQGRVQSWNPGAERLLGYREDEILGQSAAILFTPEDIQAGLPQQEMRESLEEGRKCREHWCVRKDGSRLWCGGVMTPLWDEGRKLRGFARIMRNRTESRRAEDERAGESRDAARRLRLYEAALSSTPDLVYVFDLDHRFTYANEGLLTMWGRTWDEAIGKNCLELGYAPWHAAMHDREIEQVVASKQPIKGEVPFTGTFGHRIYEYIFVPVIGENGEVEAVAGTTRDVTDRTRAEEALRNAHRRKDEFLATLAHELRNPLAPIRNSLQILKMPRVDAPTARQTTDMMERQVDHLVRLVDDLLDVSRVMSGKIELRREPVELATVVARAVETAQPLIEVQGHKLELSLPPESLLIDADPVRLAQVVGNLLTNSAKYTESNGHIWLAAQREDGKAVLRVRDNGIGIAPDMLPHVFDLFVQAGHSSTKAHGGLGIGLTLVKNLIELHQGSVEAHSAGLGQGCEFVVRLPLMAPRRQQPVEENGGRSQDTPISGHRLLVVDDNQDAASSLAMLLRLHGHDVRVANDGALAIEAAQAFHPDVVFLDLGMPGMDGYEVARRMRKMPELQNTILAALTGWGQKEDRRRTQEAGFDHHLVKPPEPKALEKLLAELK